MLKKKADNYSVTKTCNILMYPEEGTHILVCPLDEIRTEISSDKYQCCNMATNMTSPNKYDDDVAS